MERFHRDTLSHSLDGILILSLGGIRGNDTCLTSLPLRTDIISTVPDYNIDDRAMDPCNEAHGMTRLRRTLTDRPNGQPSNRGHGRHPFIIPP